MARPVAKERVWHLRSGSIDEVVRAPDQWDAWATLADRDVTEFGVLASAEPDENGDPILFRTVTLFRCWGRDIDADALTAAMVELGYPDTTEQDREIATKRRAA